MPRQQCNDCKQTSSQLAASSSPYITFCMQIVPLVGFQRECVFYAKRQEEGAVLPAETERKLSGFVAMTQRQHKAIQIFLTADILICHCRKGTGMLATLPLSVRFRACIVHTGSPAWLPGPLKWNRAILKLFVTPMKKPCGASSNIIFVSSTERKPLLSDGTVFTLARWKIVISTIFNSGLIGSQLLCN